MPQNPFKRLQAIWRSFDPQTKLRGQRAAAQILNIPLNIDKTLNVANTALNRTGYEAFKDVKIPGQDKTLDVLCKEFKDDQNNLNHNEARVIEVLTGLKTENPNENIATAFQNFQRAIRALSPQINKVPPNYSPLGVRDLLSKKKDLVLKAVIKRQEDELIALKEKFGIDAHNQPKDNAFENVVLRTALSQQPPAGLGLDLGANNANLPAIYKQFEAALIKKHQEEKAGIEKVLNEDITSMDKCYEKKVLKSEYFNEMYENADYYGADNLKSYIEQTKTYDFHLVQNFDVNNPNQYKNCYVLGNYQAYQNYDPQNPPQNPPQPIVYYYDKDGLAKQINIVNCDHFLQQFHLQHQGMHNNKLTLSFNDIKLLTGDKPNTISFDNVTIEEMGQLSALVTVTGLPITLEKRKEKNEAGEDKDVNVLKVELRSGFKSRFYDEKYDVRSLMNAARSAGIDPLHISITHTDVDYDKEGNMIGGDGLKLAKLAYCEAIRAGYKPEDIKLKINGKPADTKDEKKYLTSDQLFGNDTNMLQTAKEAAKRKQARIDEHKNPQEIKDESAKIREALGDVNEPQENVIKQGL